MRRALSVPATAMVVFLVAGAVFAQSSLWVGFMTSGRRSFAEGDYAKAVELFEAAEAEFGDEAGAGNVRYAETIYELGRAERRAGVSEAEEHLREALEIFEAERGGGAPETAGALLELGGLLGEEAMLRRAIAIGEATLGPEDPLVLDALRESALLALEQGDHARAELVYRKVLAAANRAYEPDDPRMVEVLSTMAGIYVAQGEHARALSLYRRALGSAPAKLRPGLLLRMARAHQAAGESAEAEERYVEALDAFQGSAATEESSAAAYEVAEFYRQQDRYDAAEPWFERAVTETKLVHGDAAPELIPILEDYSALLWRNGAKLKATRMRGRIEWLRTRKTVKKAL